VGSNDRSFLKGKTIKGASIVEEALVRCEMGNVKLLGLRVFWSFLDLVKNTEI
jgi:hypothetical protein